MSEPGSLDHAPVDNGALDTVSLVLLSLGILGGVIQLAFRPFLFGPLALLAVLIGTAMSAKYRRLSLIALGVISICFIIGAAITAYDSRPLY